MGILLPLIILISPEYTEAVKKVTIEIPVESEIKLKSDSRIMIYDFSVSKKVKFALEESLKKYLAREIRKNTEYEILNPSFKNNKNRIDQGKKRNKKFWQDLTTKKDCELVITGKAHYESENRSGYETVTRRTVYGRTYQDTIYVDRTAAIMKVKLVFISGDNGEKLFSKTFKNEGVYKGISIDTVKAFYDLIEPHRSEILEIITTNTIEEKRYVFE